MIELKELERYCNQLLDAAAFEDYCPNGLQVDAGSSQVRTLVTGVTASQALIEAAVEAKADLLLVHHGYFWRGEAAPLVGVKGRRIRTLMREGVSLLAYHLPLDAHPDLGNNRCLGGRLGLEGGAPMAGGYAWQGGFARAQTVDSVCALLQRQLGQAPQHLAGGPDEILRVGWCTGAAQGGIEQAAALGLDAFISGEVSESTTHLARELGIHYFAAGHHATEKYGIQALGAHLSEKFHIEHLFIDIPNPV